ncbi:MAG: transcriptional regulator, GntR family [Gemmatimonadetes bacterium]|nr:transcriptional regulator, GntR family [Gemmatimonadota bacterium]
MRQTTSPLILALIPLDRAGAASLHRQVYDGIRKAILEGLLRAGERVPATRQFALDLEVSRLTVLTAYEQLLHEGYLEARVGSGTFVSASLPDHSLHVGAPAREPQKVRTIPARPARSVVTDSPDGSSSYASDGGGGLRPFRVGLPAVDAFPQQLWSRLVARRARGLTASHMAYGSPAGLRDLRAAIAAHLRSARRVRCEEDDVIIVSGSQTALRLCAAVLLPAGSHGAMEDPGYAGARAALTASGAQMLPVPVDAEGIMVSKLDGLGQLVRAAYVTPSHQYPLGMSMSATRRLALLEWARRRSAWIIEDDYDSEYRYVSRPLGALQGMETDADVNRTRRVIYIGTFSKVMFPALRVGYLVVPPSLRQAFLDAREASDLFPSTLYQLALSDFLTEGHFARHLRRMRGIYVGRRQAILDGLATHCAGLLELENADAGLHVTTRLPKGRNDMALVKALSARGLSATALSPCYAGRGAQPGLLLGFGGSREPTLRRATRILADVMLAGS